MKLFHVSFILELFLKYTKSKQQSDNDDSVTSSFYEEIDVHTDAAQCNTRCKPGQTCIKVTTNEAYNINSWHWSCQYPERAVTPSKFFFNYQYVF